MAWGLRMKAHRTYRTPWLKARQARGKPGGPSRRGGCSSYQSLSKFAGTKRPPILRSGLRGNPQKTCFGADLGQKRQKKGQKTLIFGFFGTFWPFLAIFDVFYPFLGPKSPPTRISLQYPRRRQPAPHPSGYTHY